MTKVRVGIVGAGFGERVLAPAFRRAGADLVALATRSDRTARAAARRLGIPRAYGNWKKLIEDPAVEAVAIAVPPVQQPPIARAALRSGKAVFAEKPLATTTAAARLLAQTARLHRRPTAVDFELFEIPAWQVAEKILRSGKLGRLRHVSLVWQVEIFANRNRLSSWKTRSRDGGGALFAFASHSFHYLERFCGPIVSVRAHLHAAPDLPGPQDTLLSFTAQCAKGPVIEGSICSHAYLGSGHRLEFYGEKGTMVLGNSTDDYGRGFQLRVGTRAAGRLLPVKVPKSGRDEGDGRIAPVARLAARFLASCRKGGLVQPGFDEGLRVQILLDACRRSHRLGRKVRVS